MAFFFYEACSEFGICFLMLISICNAYRITWPWAEIWSVKLLLLSFCRFLFLFFYFFFLYSAFLFFYFFLTNYLASGITSTGNVRGVDTTEIPGFGPPSGWREGVPGDRGFMYISSVTSMEQYDESARDQI